MRRATLVRSWSVSGRGLHTGEWCAVQLHPAPWETGLCWRIGPDRFRTCLDHAVSLPGASGVSCRAVLARTVEHLMAVLVAAGVTDVEIELEGEELPALGGGGLGWVAAVEDLRRGPSVVPLRVREPFSWEGIDFLPSDTLEVSVDVDFGDNGPRGSALWGGTFSEFVREIAWARTFVRAEEVSALRAAGRGRGADRSNTLVWGEETTAPLDEPVRHKLLDAIGDLGLLGHPFAGKVHVRKGTHARHLQAIRALADAHGWSTKAPLP